jgi:hypothetical protein
VKKTLQTLFIAIILNAWAQPLYSQTRQSHSIIFSFLQLKEKFNSGMDNGLWNGEQIASFAWIDDTGAGIFRRNT